MFTLCFVAFFVFVFHLSFIFSFILHPSCIAHIFFSFPPSSWLMCTFLERGNSTSCTFVEGESHKRDVYTKGEKTFFFFWENLVLFCFTLCLFSCCFMVLWVMFSINVLFLSSHRVYVLDIHTSLCYCALLVACSDDHLLCYIIIVVISIWQFCVWSIFTCYIILILLSLDLP